MGGCGAHENSDTRVIKGLMNSKPPVGKAVPDLHIPLGRFRAQMLSAHILCCQEEKGRTGISKYIIKIHFIYNMKKNVTSLSPLSQNGKREKQSKSHQAVDGYCQMVTV